MTRVDTPAEYRAALDQLLATDPRPLRIYDHDLDLLGLDALARHDTLRALCVAGGGRRIDILLDDISQVARAHPRLMQLVRDFGHVLDIRQADADAPRPDQAFVLAGRQSALVRPDKRAISGALHPGDTPLAVSLQQSFETLWQHAQTRVSATTLGL
jgi:hypothetical protein